jgi:hypothetical protein
MHTATRSRKNPAKADTVSAEIATTIAAAVDKWRAMVDQVADGGPTPPAREILDAAALLGIREPGEALEDDAQVVANVRAMQARCQRERDDHAAKIAAVGGPAGIAAKVAKLKQELRALEALNGPGVAMCLGHLAAAATGERRKHPRLYDVAYRGEALR